MTKQLLQTMEKLTPQELSELEMFAMFLLAKRNLKIAEYLTDEISTQELTKLVEASAGFDWLSSSKEDAYSIDDGKAVEW